MRLAAVLLALALSWAGALGAEGTDPSSDPLAAAASALPGPSPLVRSGLDDLRSGPAAAAWQAVGRLDIDGKGFCTGTLIAPNLVLTAAHCLFDRDSGQAVDPARIEFRAGFRDGWSAASGAARRAMAHPAYVFDPRAGAAGSARDVALVELAEPIGDRITPFETAGDPLATGAEVSVVSYAVGRSEAPSREEGCGVLGSERGVLVLTCDVDFGASGAPIFRMDGSIARIVSVVSAKGELDGHRVALGTALSEPLAELRAAFDALPAGPEMAAAGVRTDIGALFVRAGASAPSTAP